LFPKDCTLRLPNHVSIVALQPCRSLLAHALPKPTRRSVCQRRRQEGVSFRGTQFAAAIPGDGVIEQVFTSGISSFLCALTLCSSRLGLASAENTPTPLLAHRPQQRTAALFFLLSCQESGCGVQQDSLKQDATQKNVAGDSSKTGWKAQAPGHYTLVN